MLMRCDCFHAHARSLHLLRLVDADTASYFFFEMEVLFAHSNSIQGPKRRAKAQKPARLPHSLSKSCVYPSLTFEVSTRILKMFSAALFPAAPSMLRVSGIAFL